MPQTPAPLNKDKSRFMRGMEAAQAIQNPVEREWSILDVHCDLYDCAQGAIRYIQESKNPEVLSLLTDAPSQVDSRLYSLQFNLKFEARIAQEKYEAIIEKNRKVKEFFGEQEYSCTNQEFDDALSIFDDADSEYTRVTKSIRHAINGSDRAMNCQYDKNKSIMENFIAAGEWLKTKEQEVLKNYGPRPEVELAF